MLKQATRATHELVRYKNAEGLQGTSDRPIAVRSDFVFASAMEVISGMFGTVIGVLGSIGIVVVLVMFFLIRRDDLRDRFIRLVGGGQVTQTTRAVGRRWHEGQPISVDAVWRKLLSRYFGCPRALPDRCAECGSLGNHSGCAAVHSVCGRVDRRNRANRPFDGYLRQLASAIFTLGLFVVLELLTANILEPWLYGKHTGVSPVAVLVAAVFWTWLWGIPGLLLATPMTVCLLVVGKHVPQLSLLTVLLGNEPVFETKTRVYQRLLAGDQEEAAELLEQSLEDEPLARIYDTILIPALARTESDWLRGELNDARRTFIFQSVKEIIEGLGESQRAPSSTKIEPADTTEVDADSVVQVHSLRPCILCLPARTEADEIAGMMLAQLLSSEAGDVRSLPPTAQASEIVDFVEKHEAVAICISAMAPAAIMHARHLFKRLRREFPAVRILVGLWGASGDLTKARNRIGSGEMSSVVATLAEAQSRSVSLPVSTRTASRHKHCLLSRCRRADSASTARQPLFSKRGAAMTSDDTSLSSQEMEERFDLLATDAKEYALFLVEPGRASDLLERRGGTHVRLPVQ